MKKLIIALIIVVLLVVLAFIGTKNADKKEETKEIVNEETKEENLLSGKKIVEMSIKNYGKVTMELDADTAPITVTNFVNLVKSEFYNGLTFHRIIAGFMAQGGDPKGDGTGGSGKNIKGEFSQNGVENNISHVRGVVSMARAGDPDSASSQFFIVTDDSKFLDGQYAGFGKVTDGMDVVDKMVKDAKPTDDNGTIAKEDQPVIEYIKIID